MLAQNFRTARQLKITKQEHAALIGVLRMLERGEMVHTQMDDWNAISEALQANKHPFSMATFCGSAQCIGGWCDVLYGTQFTGKADANPFDLIDLFYVEEDGKHAFPEGNKFLDDVTVEEAAHALRNYLTTGKPNWKDVLA